MQGQINPTGHLQGSINPTGNLQGTMSTESLIGGQVVGMRGFTGNGIESAVLNEDYTLTLNFTNGTSYTTPSIRGQIGETGNGIASISKTGTSGLVDTYTITFTDGTTTTFDVTNGSGDMNKEVYDTNDDGVVNEADSVKWSGVYDKPETFPPSAHNHDGVYVKPTDYASGSDAGVVKTTSTYGVGTNASGYLYGLNIPPAQYEQTSINAIVSKGTLDAQIEIVEEEIPDVINGVNSTSTEDALSANMGKELQTQITNLKNLGRFCAIWRADTGLPTSEPTETPYNYKVGDYFRIGATGYRVPTGSTYVQGAYDTVAEETGIGDVWYYDGTSWLKQASSGGGTVQDVLVNGTSVLDGGIAEITVPTLLADLIADATHRLVTDTEKTLWDSKTKVTINRWESDD